MAGVIQADRQLAAVIAMANGYAWTAQMYADGLLDDDEIMIAIVEYRAAQGTSGSAQDAQRLDPQGAGPVAESDAPNTNPHQEDTSHDTD